jgi:hypothetical protein
LPVLHITKYHLLLNRFLKLTNENDDEKTFTSMQEALNIMKKVADEINNSITDILPTGNKIFNTNDMQKLIDTYGDILKEVGIGLVDTLLEYIFYFFRVNCIW